MKEVLCSKQCAKATGARSVVRQCAKSPRRFRFKVVTSLLLALITLTSLSRPGIHAPAVDAQSTKARYQQDLAQVFTNHEDVQLDPHTAAESVKHTGHLSVQTPAQDFEIDLVLNDLRAPNYRAEEVVDGVVARAVEMPAPDTYKGKVSGMPDSEARTAVFVIPLWFQMTDEQCSAAVGAEGAINGIQPDQPQRLMTTWGAREGVEVIELLNHPFFIASQFHPEFRSKPHQPHPLFKGFIGAAHEHIHQRPL